MIVKVRRGTIRDVRQQILGDTVASATWSCTPMRTTSVSNTDTATTARVTVGVTTDVDLTLVPHIVGTSGQEYEPVTPLTIKVV